MDVGTGTGVLVEYILNFVGEEGEVIGVDISERMIEKAREKYKGKKNVRFLHCDVMDLEFEEYFDAIICYSVFPHFEDKKKTVQKLSTMLKENGKLVICHSQSRQEINNLHKNLPEPVKRHFLPELFVIIKWIEEASLKPKYWIDNEVMFLVIAQKSK